MIGQTARAAVFDMDGVLIDTEPVWRAAEVEVFSNLGIELTDRELMASTGLPIDRTIAEFWRARPWERRRPGHPTDAEIARQIEARVVDRVIACGEPMPGVRQAIALMTDLGLHLAIASSSPHTVIEAVCTRLALTAIEVRCSAMDEVRGKPAPDVYLTAAQRLGVGPASCIGIEDSPTGVIAVKAAGMRCLAIPDPLLGSHPVYQEADLVLTSLVKLTRLDLWSLGCRDTRAFGAE